jgi:hypothetical protein
MKNAALYRKYFHPAVKLFIIHYSFFTNKGDAAMSKEYSKGYFPL